jgi:amino acid transporter
VVIVAGFAFDHEDFARALLAREGRPVPEVAAPPFRLATFLAAATLLFSSFIGFDSIAQAGGEAKNPARNLPLATGLAVLVAGGFYLLFTAAVYHAVPWPYVAEQAMVRDVTAPGLLGQLLPAGFTVAIVGGAAVALTNDLPAMLLAVSRLLFAWGEDGILPAAVARVHQHWHTPHLALLVSGAVASVGVLGSHLAGDFFLGVDILVTSMLVNFIVMCLSVLSLPRRNPELARRITVMPSRRAQVAVASLGALLLSLFLVVHVTKDLSSSARAFYLRSTPVWLVVMAAGSLLYWRARARLRRQGVDVRAAFGALPAE